MTPREITDGQAGLFQQEIRQMTCADQSAGPPVSMMALHGLGKAIWEGMDAQAYVSALRREWERTGMQSPDTLPENTDGYFSDDGIFTGGALIA